MEPLANKHPQAGVSFVYGTAGFRTASSTLDPVLFRVGILANLRARKLNKVVGAMITASHNHHLDNGVKLVEPLGEMLVPSWEPYATKLANAIDHHAILAVVAEIAKLEDIDLSKQMSNAKVVVARDTRPSGLALTQSLHDGVLSLGQVEFVDYGVFTTPQLHYVVRCLNTANDVRPYGEPTDVGYFDKLSKSFKVIVEEKEPLSTLYVDCANGVGAIAMKSLLNQLGSDLISAELFNVDISEPLKLNHNCGADYVKMKQAQPEGFIIKPGMRCCSLDGDADRIVYYYVDSNFKFKLLDGDKIATLVAGFIMDLVTKSNFQINNKAPKVGLIQTAYANGSSTFFAKEKLKIPVVFTMTGVKHLHHAAEKFDIGVYFEANGHGTVLFSEACKAAFSDTKGKDNEQKKALNTLFALSEVINQAVGDALSDLLMVESVLSLNHQTLEEWDSSYTDLPSRQIKVKVANRHIFKPVNADTQLAEPVGLQDEIDRVVLRFEKGRAFVRPSGTEDCVRVYAEAGSVGETEELAGEVCGLVFDGFGGVGERKFI